ncbi:uncharacterized protein LOC113490839 [Athene cunicularia]|uniref:uncharacterized protein LOC113490839 n=1 Tax=Athene cunicularia TaxID=194338 RepID=UPI000EF72189|nr:uncharacterized protein LOC113490839 [Athene cunicularia]
MQVYNNPTQVGVSRSPALGPRRGRGAPGASQGCPHAALLLCLGRFRGPGSSVLPGGLCCASCRGCRAGGSVRGPCPWPKRRVSPWGSGSCDITEEKSPRVSPGCWAAAPAAVRLGPATMAVGITRVLMVLTVLQHMLRMDDQSDPATQDLLQQREKQQQQEMTWLMEQMEQRSQELCSLTLVGMLPAVCQHWWFWASAETLLLLFELYQLRRQRSAVSNSSSQQGSCSGAKEQREEGDWEGKAEPCDSGSRKAFAASAKPFPRTRL